MLTPVHVYIIVYIHIYIHILICQICIWRPPFVYWLMKQSLTHPANLGSRHFAIDFQTGVMTKKGILGGGNSNIFLFSPLFGEDSHFG